MATVFRGGTSGPWLCDDTLVLCDGYILNGYYTDRGPSVDGIGEDASVRKRGRELPGGLIQHTSDRVGMVKGSEHR